MQSINSDNVFVTYIYGLGINEINDSNDKRDKRAKLVLLLLFCTCATREAV